MTDIQTLRLLISDRRKVAVNEVVGQGDGANRHFRLDMYPLASSPTAVLAIYLTGVTAATNTYTISGGAGRLIFNVGAEPADGATILANYSYHALTSGELSDILSGLTGRPYLAAANAALILAADSSRYFAYKMGEKSVDKRQVSKQFRELAKSLIARHNELLRLNSYNAGNFTFADASNTVYEDYDSAIAYLEDTTG